jgi:hypothetical protein
MKIVRLAAMAACCLTMTSGVVAAAPDPAPIHPVAKSPFLEMLKTIRPTPVVHSVIPKEMGCHVESEPGVLTKVACMTPAQIAKFPPPAPCTGADGDAACGMQSTVTNTQKAFGINQIPMTEAFLGVTLAEYSSSSDTRYGSGGYSLQLNSNYFPANASTTGWVQFVYQDFASSARFCVWNIHWPSNGSGSSVYTPVCTALQPIPLTARLQFTVGGFVCAGSCTYFRPGGTKGPAVLWGWLHWATLNANGSVCDSCASGTVWATAPDSEELASHWTQISGSILGASQSKINFSGNTVVQNTLGATACSVPEAPGWTCATPQLDGQYADTAGWVTAEANNLIYAPNPNWVSPQAPQSDLVCSNGFCWLQDYEIFPSQ